MTTQGLRKTDDSPKSCYVYANNRSDGTQAAAVTWYRPDTYGRTTIDDHLSDLFKAKKAPLVILYTSIHEVIQCHVSGIAIFQDLPRASPEILSTRGVDRRRDGYTQRVHCAAETGFRALIATVTLTWSRLVSMWTFSMRLQS